MIFMRFFLILMMFALLSAPARAGEGEADQRMAKLTQLFDRNEGAIAYHRFCVSDTELPGQRFMDNSHVIFAALEEALAVKFPDKTRKEIEAEILRRSEALQRNQDVYFRRGGCDGEDVHALAAHYDMMSRMEAADLKGFIARFTGVTEQEIQKP